MKTLFTIFLLVFSLSLFAQESPKKPEKPKRKLSFSQLFKEIENCQDTIYRLENAVINLQNEPERFTNRYLADSISHSYDTILIKPQIELKNIQFEGGNVLCFRKMKFARRMILQQIKETHLKIIFDYCSFANDLDLQNNHFYVIQMSNSGFKTNLNVIKTNTFHNGICFQFLKSNVNTFFINDVDNLNLEITNAKIATFYTTDVRGEENLLNIKKTELNDLFIENTQIKASQWLDCVIKKNFLNMTDNHIIYLEKLKVLDTLFWLIDTEKSLDVVDCDFQKPITLNIINLPNENTHFRWKFLNKKIVFADGSSGKPYQAITNEELKNEDKFSKLMAIYFRFYAIYKFCGDMESANACYVEMKEIETRKLKHDHEQKQTLKTYLDWQMNEFLHTFSDYGTDYVKSLIYAFYVILGFALLYFIFPSQEDNLSKNRFLKFFTKAIEYFRTDKQILDFQQEKRKEELEKLENFRQNLVNSQSEIPRIISFLGKPFYYQNLYLTEFALWLLHRTDLAKGKWSEIPARRKLFLGTLVSVYFVFYVCNGLFMRALNAFALSLNFFTTLGYGEMQARGWIKYLAVLEGAVGWFLLTVFSASLVSQLLQ